MTLLADLEGMISELRDLKFQKNEQQREIAELTRNLQRAEKSVRSLRDQLALLEREPAMLDGRDEDFLWNTQAMIEFTQRLDGSRSLKIKSPSRTLSRVTGHAGQPLLAKAMEEASGRARNRSEDQAAPRTSQGS